MHSAQAERLSAFATRHSDKNSVESFCFCMYFPTSAFRFPNSKSSALCSLPFPLCPMRYAPPPMRFVLPPMPHALCPMLFAFSIRIRPQFNHTLRPPKRLTSFHLLLSILCLPSVAFMAKGGPLSSDICHLSSVICRLSFVPCRRSSVLCRLSSVFNLLSPDLLSFIAFSSTMADRCSCSADFSKSCKVC